MRSRVHIALFAMLPMACQSQGGKSLGSAPPETRKESAMNPTRSVHPAIIGRFCGRPPGPAPMIVNVLKDSAGNIGGYTHALGIMDSPIYYLDAHGKDYAMFHIFGSAAEKARNQPLIDSLLKAYPVTEPLVCP
jgi:hypothetical protein